MRFIEIMGGILQPISIEESMIVDKIYGNIDPLPTDQLNEREQELARKMVSRGVLARVKMEGKIHLLVNKLQEL
jgi:hypothetical protein